MSGYAAHKLQEAVYTALSIDTNLTAIVTDVYDEPPSGAIMPYVSMGDTSSMPSDTKTEARSTVTFRIDTWSEEASQMQSKDVMALIDENLHMADLTVDGFDLIYLILVKSQVVRKSDVATPYYEGQMTYKALLYKQ